MILSILTITTDTIADSEAVAAELLKLGKNIGANANKGSRVEVFIYDDPKEQIVAMLRRLVGSPTH